MNVRLQTKAAELWTHSQERLIKHPDLPEEHTARISEDPEKES
ncbi:MAG: hypothetical protein ACFFBS_01115 [Promethearchaeota archaeon]